jgi:hypothetical protein
MRPSETPENGKYQDATPALYFPSPFGEGAGGEVAVKYPLFHVAKNAYESSKYVILAQVALKNSAAG